MMNVANEVSSILSELESLRATTETLRHSNSILEFENQQLRGGLEKAKLERDHYMIKQAELKVLLDQTGAALVAGVQKLNERMRDDLPIAEAARLLSGGDKGGKQ